MRRRFSATKANSSSTTAREQPRRDFVLRQRLLQGRPADGCRDPGGEPPPRLGEAPRPKRLVLIGDLAERLGEGELEQGLLALDIAVERTGGNPRLTRDIDHLGQAEALPDEDGQRRRRDIPQAAGLPLTHEN